MTFLYTARGAYDKKYDQDGSSWDKYIEFSGLTHLKELVSVDGILNELIVEHDRQNTEDWNQVIFDDHTETGFFKTLDFVIQKAKPIGKFNLLGIIINPTQECQNIPLNNFEFVGYDLLDQDYSISALANCGGFDESFIASDLNEYGLIDNHLKACRIQKSSLDNNPDEHHADTNIIAIWRHQTIGRKKVVS